MRALRDWELDGIPEFGFILENNLGMVSMMDAFFIRV